jgi:hypothetical protein
VKAAERALAEGAPLLESAVQYRMFGVEGWSHERLYLAGGGLLRGSPVRQYLGLAEHVVAAVCTIGRTLEERVSEVMESDLQHALALDGVGSAAAEALAAAACHHFERQAESDGMRATIPLSPGMTGWTVLEGQRQVFDVLNPEQIGVELLPSGMMLPRKSVSLVLGLGRDVSADGTPCDHCGMRDRCRYRSL